MMFQGVICIALCVLFSSSVKGQMTCVEAQEQLSKEPAMTCNNILTTSDLFNMRDDNIQNYCNKNCTTVLMSIYQSIKTACGGGVDPSDPNDPYFNILKEACWNFNHTGLCLTLWKLYISPLETGVVNNFTTTYQLCEQDYERSRTNCTGNCQSALKQILDKTGCCYDVIEKIGIPFLGADMIRTCGYSVPSCSPTSDSSSNVKNKRSNTSG